MAEAKTASPTTSPPALPRSWSSLAFEGLTPEDGGASLFRKWHGSIVALRSDGEMFSIALNFLQQDSPMHMGQVLAEAIERLESYRICACTAKALCALHRAMEKP